MGISTKNKIILTVLSVGVIAGAATAPLFGLATTTRETMRDEMKDKMMNLREERKETMDEMRQKMEDMRVKRQAMMAEFKDKREAFREEAKARMDAMKKKLGEEKARRIEEFFSNMVRKFENAIDRLNKLADRVETHLNKLADGGKDVAALRTALESARGKITAVETALNAAKTEFGSMTLSGDTKAAFKKVKELVRSVAEKAKDAHKSLVDVIKSIRGASQSPTTTPSQ